MMTCSGLYRGYMLTLDDDLLFSSWLFMHLLVAFFVLLYRSSSIALMQLAISCSALGEQVILSEDLMAVDEASYSYMRRPSWPPSFVDIFFHLGFFRQFLGFCNIWHLMLLMVDFVHVLMNKCSCSVQSFAHGLVIILLNERLEEKCKVRTRLQEGVRIFNTYLLRQKLEQSKFFQG